MVQRRNTWGITMSTNHQPVSSFTKFEINFSHEISRAKRAKILILSALSVALILGFLITMTALGQLNKDIAGVFDSEHLLWKRGPVHSATAK